MADFLVLQLRLLVLAWHTTMPVGIWVMRTAESVVLTLWPPGPDDAEHVDPQVVVVDLDRHVHGVFCFREPQKLPRR